MENALRRFPRFLNEIKERINVATERKRPPNNKIQNMSFHPSLLTRSPNLSEGDFFVLFFLLSPRIEAITTC